MRWEGGKASTLGRCSGQLELSPLRRSSENLCGIQLRKEKAGALIQWLLLPSHPLPDWVKGTRNVDMKARAAAAIL